MLKAFLAGSGGEIAIPDAESVVAGETPETIDFVDAKGRVLVTFRRADLAMFTEDGSVYSQNLASSDGNRAADS